MGSEKIATLGGLVPGNPISKTITDLATQAQTAVKLPELYQLQNVLSRLSKNVQSAQTADGAKTSDLQLQRSEDFNFQGSFYTTASTDRSTDIFNHSELTMDINNAIVASGVRGVGGTMPVKRRRRAFCVV